MNLGGQPPMPPEDQPSQPPPPLPCDNEYVNPAPPVDSPGAGGKPPLPSEPPPDEQDLQPIDEGEQQKLTELQKKAAEWQRQQKWQQQQDRYNRFQESVGWVPASQAVAVVLKQEAEFDEQYRQWKQQYEDWKEQNKNHPNQEQYQEYEQTWKQYERQMEEKQRDILDRKQLAFELQRKDMEEKKIGIYGKGNRGSNGPGPGPGPQQNMGIRGPPNQGPRPPHMGGPPDFRGPSDHPGMHPNHRGPPPPMGGPGGPRHRGPPPPPMQHRGPPPHHGGPPPQHGGPRPHDFGGPPRRGSPLPHQGGPRFPGPPGVRPRFDRSSQSPPMFDDMPPGPDRYNNVVLEDCDEGNRQDVQSLMSIGPERPLKVRPIKKPSGGEPMSLLDIQLERPPKLKSTVVDMDLDDDNDSMMEGGLAGPGGRPMRGGRGGRHPGNNGRGRGGRDGGPGMGMDNDGPMDMYDRDADFMDNHGPGFDDGPMMGGPGRGMPPRGRGMRGDFRGRGGRGGMFSGPDYPGDNMGRGMRGPSMEDDRFGDPGMRGMRDDFGPPDNFRNDNFGHDGPPDGRMMPPGCDPDGPNMPPGPGGPMMGPDGPNMPPGPGGPMMGPDGPNMPPGPGGPMMPQGPGGPMMGPDGPNMPPVSGPMMGGGPMMPPGGPMMPPGGPMMPPGGPMMGPMMPPAGPMMYPAGPMMMPMGAPMMMPGMDPYMQNTPLFPPPPVPEQPAATEATEDKTKAKKVEHHIARGPQLKDGAKTAKGKKQNNSDQTADAKKPAEQKQGKKKAETKPDVKKKEDTLAKTEETKTETSVGTTDTNILIKQGPALKPKEDSEEVKKETNKPGAPKKTPPATPYSLEDKFPKAKPPGPPPGRPPVDAAKKDSSKKDADDKRDDKRDYDRKDYNRRDDRRDRDRRDDRRSRERRDDRRDYDRRDYDRKDYDRRDDRRDYDRRDDRRDYDRRDDRRDYDKRDDYRDSDRRGDRRSRDRQGRGYSPGGGSQSGSKSYNDDVIDLTEDRRGSTSLVPYGEEDGDDHKPEDRRGLERSLRDLAERDRPPLDDPYEIARHRVSEELADRRLPPPGRPLPLRDPLDPYDRLRRDPYLDRVYDDPYLFDRFDRLPPPRLPDPYAYDRLAAPLPPPLYERDLYRLPPDPYAPLPLDYGLPPRAPAEPEPPAAPAVIDYGHGQADDPPVPQSIDYGHGSDAASDNNSLLNRDRESSLGGSNTDDYVPTRDIERDQYEQNMPSDRFDYNRDNGSGYRDEGNDRFDRDRNRDLSSFRNRESSSEQFKNSIYSRDRQDPDDFMRGDRFDSRGGQDYRSPSSGSYNSPSQFVSPYGFNKKAVPPPPKEEPKKPEVINIDEILCSPGRKKRPEHIVIILRGLPGSGKSYVSQLIKTKEMANGGPAPRILALDDYFLVETEKTEHDLETGKRFKRSVMEYEYDAAMEESYKQNFLKSYKRQIDECYFNFFIIDSMFDKAKYLEEFWSHAKSKGFQVYIAEVQADVLTCTKRNIHNRSHMDIKKLNDKWEETPFHHTRLDIRSLLQDAAITEVEMEDMSDNDVEEVASQDTAEEEDNDGVAKSKWELDTSGAKLDKLDGLRFGIHKHELNEQGMDEYLQLPDDYDTRTSQPGKKRVRWADIESRKSQARMRDIGFVVGGTNWDKMTDDSYADRALNQTKYI